MQRLRERLPLVVAIFLLLLLVMLVGFACACATDHPMQAIERAVSAIAAVPAVIDVWSLLVATLLVVGFVLPQPRRALGRGSPADLQRFLF
jgi:predicted RND superfamily exporter protein